MSIVWSPPEVRSFSRLYPWRWIPACHECFGMERVFLADRVRSARTCLFEARVGIFWGVHLWFISCSPLAIESSKHEVCATRVGFQRAIFAVELCFWLIASALRKLAFFESHIFSRYCGIYSVCSRSNRSPLIVRLSPYNNTGLGCKCLKFRHPFYISAGSNMPAGTLARCGTTRTLPE